MKNASQLVGKIVSYRYMNVPPGIVLEAKDDHILLDVDEESVKFTKWVHVNSVNTNPGRMPASHSSVKVTATALTPLSKSRLSA